MKAPHGIYKAKAIRDTAKNRLIDAVKNGQGLPVWLESYANRILALENLIIDFKYGLK